MSVSRRRRTLAPSTSWSNSVPWAARDGYIDTPIHLTCDEKFVKSKVWNTIFISLYISISSASAAQFSQVDRSGFSRSVTLFSEGNEALLALAKTVLGGDASFLPICRRWMAWTWRPRSGNCVLWLGQPTSARRRSWRFQLWFNRSRRPKQLGNLPEESPGPIVGENFFERSREGNGTKNKKGDWRWDRRREDNWLRRRCRGGTGKNKGDGRWDGREDSWLHHHHFRHCASYLFHHWSLGFPVPAQEAATRTNAASTAGSLCLWTLWWLWPSRSPNLLV